MTANVFSVLYGKAVAVVATGESRLRPPPGQEMSDLSQFRQDQMRTK